jgi:hypothetical protein
VFYFGSYQFKPPVNTKLFFVDIKKDGGDYWLRVLLGMNEVNGEIVSAMKISYSVLIIGFNNLAYAKYSKGMFRIVSKGASDLGGKLHNRPTVLEKMQIQRNGTLR